MHGATPPQSVVVMGVSGSGKTTVARGLAEATGWEFAEGDDFHPAANVRKMRSGEPLTDADRLPWLEAIAGWIDERRRAGRSVVLTCSALRRSYRDLLREGRPGMRFVELAADPAVIEKRLARRRGHYMPPSLLPSQIATLEPLAADEPGVVVDGEGEPEHVVRAALQALGLDRTEPPAT